MKILVTGANGQLGCELRQLSGNYPEHDFLFTDFPELDITNEHAIEQFIESNPVDAAINCAAYTAVDKAESNITNAMSVNAAAPALLAAASKRNNFLFVHISTDYVFDGKHHLPYKESHPIAPASVYGMSKAEGEKAIQQSGTKALIIRTSWLYSAFGNNFVKTMRQLTAERSELKVVCDQIGSPTWAADLAMCILQIIPQYEGSGTEIFHYSNEGVCSWFDFACAIARSESSNCRILPIRTHEYPLPAPRPAYSVMDKTSIRNTFGITIPWWEESLERCLNILRTK